MKFFLLYYTILSIIVLCSCSLPIPDTNMDSGSFYFYNTKNCTVRKCSGNNMDSPYGILNFESRYYHDKYDSVVFDLNYNEYILMDVITPSESVYYSFCMYLLDRWNSSSGDITKVSSSINDTINNFHIDKKMGTKWNERPIQILVSNNDEMNEYLQKAYTNKNAFFLSFNRFSDDIRTYDPQRDRLSLFMRIILMKDPEKLIEYTTNPPVSVRRYIVPYDFRPSGSIGVWRKRSMKGQTEWKYYSEIIPLYESVKSKFREYIIDEMYTRPHLWDITYDKGWDCIRTDTICWIDNRDTVYLWSGCLDTIPQKKLSSETYSVRGFYLDEDQLIVAVGVNHTAYENAIYHSTQLYDRTLEQGIFSFHSFPEIRTSNQSRTYEHSCNTLFGTTKYSKYYCVMYSREDFSKWNLPDEYERFYVKVSDELPYGIPKNHLAVILERMYLQSETEVSPSYHKVIYPKVFSVNRKMLCV
jgi:hypothetical protein